MKKSAHNNNQQLSVPTKRNDVAAFIQSTNRSINTLSTYVERKYYTQLNDLEIVPAPQKSLDEIAKDAWFFRVDKLAYGDENENITQKLDAVVSAVNLCGGTFCMLVDVAEDDVSLLMGVYSPSDSVGIYTLKDTLHDSLKGNFPGIQLSELSYDHTKQQLSGCFGNNEYGNRCVTAISSIANGDSNLQAGLDAIVNASVGQTFKMLVLATPANTSVVDQVRDEYEKLSTEISQLLNLNIGKQLSQSKTIDWHTAIGKTTGGSTSYGTSTSGKEEPHPKTDTDYLIQAVSAIAALSGKVGVAYGLKMVNDMIHESDDKPAKPPVHTQQDTENWGQTVQDTRGGSEGETTGETLQYNVINRSAKRLYDSIEKHLLWLENVKSSGLMNVSAYLISPSPAVNTNVASRYNALLHSGESNIFGVNTWTGDSARKIREYLVAGNHPKLLHGQYGQITPSVLMSGKELAHHLALPRTSLGGISIGTHASFGRKVLYKPNTPDSKKIRLGNIYHMGSDEDHKSVLLSFDDLVSHTLVGGACGIGKTTAVCSILTRLDESGVPFLVIEPAKGEYKKALSGISNLKVYSPMPFEQKTDALKLNPFWFREGVDPSEHIEKLKEIFCASWPMYAAMPQVLSTALYNAYVNCGWNMRTKKNALGRIFPTMNDVCAEVRKVINDSDFSAEVKGNYVGSLLTRLESLNTGIFDQVLSGGNLSDEELFENNVILDLSRPDASEFKALITGVIIMRLFEYCVCSSEILENRTLKHITVLEEAHNLLGKAKPSSEGADMREKSVEMFTRCITELGGFGQGFMIADQSPGVLCDDVIKNTNTKLLFNMPDTSDYVRCGESIALTEKQIREIPMLGRGVCVVKQTSWESPVLCHVERYVKAPCTYTPHHSQFQGRREYLSCLLKPYSVIGKNKPIATAEEQHIAKQWIWTTNLEFSQRRKLASALNRDCSWKECAEIVGLIVDPELRTQFDSHRSDIDLWTELMLDAICSEYTDDYLIALTIIEAILLVEESSDFRDMWFDATSALRKK